jgi:hypothetical protein
VLFNNIELGPFTMYSERFLGRTLKKGKLSLNLEYQVSEGALSGTNQLLLNQLTLGEKVPSPDATTLPVEFAISLLKDREGNIQLDFPVSGDLEDPEFNFGQVVLKLIGNLFSKILSSPFAAIGAAMEGEGKRAFLDFPPGLSEIDSTGTEQLDTLVTALYDHPGVTLDIQGDVAPEKERETLRRIRFDDLIRAEKARQLRSGGKGKTPASDAETRVKPEEYDVFLRKAYEAAEFPKPRDVLGNIKILPVPEMEKLLFTHIEITNADLLQLARDRASRVSEYLLESGKVDPQRIFVSEPEAIHKENAGERNSRAILTLK